MTMVAARGDSNGPLSGPGILCRIIEKAKENSRCPKRGDTVVIHFISFLEDGTNLDNTWDRNLPLKFQVGNGEVIEGLDASIENVPVGQTVELTIPSLYAYGAEGCPPNIPPFSVLIYRLKLISIDDQS